MNNFRFHAYTDIRFGKDQINTLPKLLAPYGKKVLMVYGGGSIKKNGLFDKIMELLADFTVYELSGVEPNPKITSVREGVKLCKTHDIDVVLAVGGGSTIDASKVIAGGAAYDSDPWDLVTNPEKIGKVLPIVTVLTLAATGSEMNKNAVISNMETNEKLGTASHDFIPKASICDPTYLFTLPAKQTAAGTADIMSHVFEQYFQNEKRAFLTDRIAEGLLQTCINYCPIALDEPDNYEARANLMWASTLALNGLPCSGKGGAWTCHPIEHELSAYYDITHGVGLAIVTPRWFRYILNDETVGKFCEYGRNVWNITEPDAYKCANMAIDATEEFFTECGIPMTLTELGIDDSKFEIMAEKAVRFGGLANAYVPLTKEDVVSILKACL
ncbi:MAG: iron-containing alcohol dehydrogenase [Lachnospiraceae bacterium]|nr:iron-containing alcohol dehydrogenase [Lachnospiraceae bacterium]MBQ7781957.1 iron-containing alcohol dehydrogenase [Lachnospiraceae bacterium]